MFHLDFQSHQLLFGSSRQVRQPVRHQRRPEQEPATVTLPSGEKSCQLAGLLTEQLNQTTGVDALWLECSRMYGMGPISCKACTHTTSTAKVFISNACRLII